MFKLAIAFAILFSSSTSAQQASIDFDPAKTQIRWSLAGNVHTTHGTFRLKLGRVGLNVATGAISGNIVIDAASGDSGNSARDKRMNKEILESDKFPEIRFTPDKAVGPISLSGHATVHVGGAFLIHGSAHNLDIPMDVSIASGVITGTAKFSVPYVDWGMKDPSNFLFKVDKSVEVEIVAVGKLTPK